MGLVDVDEGVRKVCHNSEDSNDQTSENSFSVEFSVEAGHLDGRILVELIDENHDPVNECPHLKFSSQLEASLLGSVKKCGTHRGPAIQNVSSFDVVDSENTHQRRHLTDVAYSSS